MGLAASFVDTTDATYLVGDVNGSGFKPTALLSRWDGESYVSIGIPTSKTIAATIDLDGSVSWTDAANKIGAKFYERPPSKSLEAGGLEIELILYDVPSSPDIPFSVECSPEVDWFYQSETLSDEELAFGGHRPEEVKGSFALYHSSRKNGKYKVGKIAHLFRPTATDVNGSWIWGVWSLDLQAGLLKASFDPTWLSKAVYPVVIGPTIGHNSIGGSSGTMASGPKQWEGQGPYTMSENGTASQIQFYGAYSVSGSVVTFGIYNDSTGVPGTRLSTSAELALSGTNAWQSIAIGGSLASGSKYWPAVQVSTQDLTIFYDGNTPPPDGRFNNSGLSYTSGAALDPAPSTSAFGGILRSLYFDYTVASSIVGSYYYSQVAGMRA